MKRLFVSSLALCGMAGVASAQAYFSFSGGASWVLPGEVQGLFSYVGPQGVGTTYNLDPGPDPSYTYVGQSGDSALPTSLSDYCAAYGGDPNAAPYVQLNADAESVVSLRNLSSTKVFQTTIEVIANIDPESYGDPYNGGSAYSFMEVVLDGNVYNSSGIYSVTIDLQPDSTQLVYLDVEGQGYCAEPMAPPPPTPEPAGIAALGMPAALFALKRRRRNSRS